jgi:hypothetical protein
MSAKPLELQTQGEANMGEKSQRMGKEKRGE